MAELRLSRSLYDAAVVDDAVAAFGSLARVTVDTHDSELVVHIDDPHPHFGERLVDEFGNYVLQATAMKLRRPA